MIVDVKGNGEGYVAKGLFDSVIVIDLNKDYSDLLIFLYNKNSNSIVSKGLRLLEGNTISCTYDNIVDTVYISNNGNVKYFDTKDVVKRVDDLIPLCKSVSTKLVIL